MTKRKKGLQEVEILKAKTVHLDKDRHVNFVPGVQTMRDELVEAAREAGILKENEHGGNEGPDVPGQVG